MKNRIKEIRELKNLTQTQLADAASTSLRMIAYLEKGERELTQRWMVRLGKALKVAPGSFVDDDKSISTAIDNDADKLLTDVIDVIVSQARKYPDLDSSLLASIGKTVYATALSGKLPKFKSGAASSKRALRGETQRLVDYEINRLN